MDLRRSVVRHSLGMPIRRRGKGSGGGQFLPGERCEQIESDVPLEVAAAACEQHDAVLHSNGWWCRVCKKHIRNGDPCEGCPRCLDWPT